jgi:PPP family 3-phenylpropionic acid transporter
MILLALLGSIIVAFTLPVTPPSVRALDDATRPRPISARAVLGRPGLVALLIVGGLVQSSHAVLYSFGSIYWQKLGFDSIAIGGFWATSIVFEVLLFLFSGFFVRLFGPFGLLVMGTLGAIVRWALFPFETTFLGFAVLQALHALSFASTYLGSQHLIARAVPEHLTASAQGLLGMISGVMLAIGTTAAGPLYRSFGGNAYFAMIVPAALALAILIGHRIAGAERH